MSSLALAPAQPYPPYFDELVYRAATVLQMHQCRVPAVPFELWSSGDELQLLASITWLPGELAPRVHVHYRRNGEFICQSLADDWFTVDPARFNVEGVVSHDEIERSIWQQEQAEAARKRRA
jgi:hypothetical protein